jgi:hypothetical protein
MYGRYNPAVAAYKNMDIENMPQDTPVEDTGLLRRKSKSSNGGLDYGNPAVRVAKQLEIIRKHRNEINGSSV